MNPAILMLMGWPLAYWATTNVLQNIRIGRERARQHGWDIEAADLEYERDLESIAMVEASKRQQQTFESSAAQSRMGFQQSMYTQEQAQLAQDRETYIKDNAFKQLSQQRSGSGVAGLDFTGYSPQYLSEIIGQLSEDQISINPISEGYTDFSNAIPAYYDSILDQEEEIYYD